ncbi:5055_t:CDS:2, partial [Racocetra persica]
TIVAIIAYVLYKFYIYPLYLSPLRKIPGPPVDNFILGNHASPPFLNKQLGEAFVHLVKQYGGIVRFHSLLNEPNLLISDQKLIQQVLLSYDYPKFHMSKTIVKEIFGEGIVIAEGNSHKRQRKVMTPSFAFANVKEMAPTFVQAGHKLKDIWIKQIGNKVEERITITELIPKITLDIIGLVGFNYEFNSTTSGSELSQAYTSIIGQNYSPLYLSLIRFFPFIRKLPTSYNKQYFKSIKIIANISEKIFAEQKNSPVQGTDLLSLITKANDSLPVNDQLTHKELISQVMTIIIAGHETTSNALSLTLYFLAKDPDTQDRLRKEVSDVLTDRNYYPTVDEIEHLKYLECVFKEAIRLIPPASAVLRYTSKDEIMNGYLVTKDTPLWIPIYAIHHDPLIWGDDAEDFNPSRWLDPEVKSKITHTNFLPFGAGPKSCLGMKMAYLEFKCLLSVIIRNFEFRLVEGYTFKTKIGGGLSRPLPGIDLWVSN